MMIARKEAQTIVGYVYTVTDKGHYLLLQSGADLPQLEQELLIRIDGRTATEQMVADMKQASEYVVKKTLESLLDRGLIMKSNIRLPEDNSLDFSAQFGQPVAPAALAESQKEAIRQEAVRGTSSLEQKGYYIGISRKAVQRRAPRNGKSYSVLLVEDDAMTAKLLKHLLGGEGFEVAIAVNRAEILKSLARTPLPDVVLLDVLLPDVNGFDVLAKLRAHPVLSAIPVIMLTGQASREDVLRGLMSGADGYITKPFDLDRVVSVVQDVLGN